MAESYSGIDVLKRTKAADTSRIRRNLRNPAMHEG